MKALSFCFFIVLSLNSVSSAQDLNASFYEQLAYRWAPMHIQYVAENGVDGLGGKADYLTAANFDGDWQMNNNWENAGKAIANFNAVVYYSIAQTKDYWYINYGFFHPRDWSNKFIIKYFDTHENDLEGELTIIKRPTQATDTSFGVFLGMVTVFHSGFYPFSNSLKGEHVKAKNLDFTTIDNVEHPITCQQSRGHGFKAFPHIKEKNHKKIHYYPSLSKSETPASNSDKKVYYKLVNIFEENGLWSRRNNKETFISPRGGFNGVYGGKYKAKPPWVWNSSLDGDELKGGEHAFSPCKLAKWYFILNTNCSEDYEFNPYLD